MIIGSCPYCDAPTMTACAPETPAVSKEECSGCKSKYWLYHSRLEPKAYTEVEFFKTYHVDEAMKVIKPRKDVA